MGPSGKSQASPLRARIAYSVVQRARESAIRQAVGATPRDVVWLVTSHVVAVVAVGLARGGLLLPNVARSLAGVIYEMSPLSWVRVVGIGLCVAAAAGAACYAPARRQVRTPLAQVLRAE